MKYFYTIEAEPICGKDFCDWCGDCLYCYGSDPCTHNSVHCWIKYGEPNKEWLENHEIGE